MFPGCNHGGVARQQPCNAVHNATTSDGNIGLRRGLTNTHPSSICVNHIPFISPGRKKVYYAHAHLQLVTPLECAATRRRPPTAPVRCLRTARTQAPAAGPLFTAAPGTAGDIDATAMSADRHPHLEYWPLVNARLEPRNPCPLMLLTADAPAAVPAVLLQVLNPMLPLLCMLLGAPTPGLTPSARGGTS